MGQTDSKLSRSTSTSSLSSHGSSGDLTSAAYHSNNIYTSSGFNRNSSTNSLNGLDDTSSLKRSTSSTEIITISKLDETKQIDPELIRLSQTPVFYPLLKVDNEDDSDDDDDSSIKKQQPNQYSVPDMDCKGTLNLCIDIQNYLKNSTGYIFEQQMLLGNKIKDVEIKQTKKMTNILQLKTSDATHAQFSVKEVLDKVKGNLDKSKEIVSKINTLILVLESILPEEESKDMKEEMCATFGPLPNLNELDFNVPSLSSTPPKSSSTPPIYQNTPTKSSSSSSTLS
ncbi:hypothetical protein CYY_000901 [Polysphondylium violaceum]|uniref:BLOC-1-related complex subunit 5 n=1 Tax=Polysphondylium violaceum TaxID=133409 RepID=A0A8J4Q1Y5_9MYCE|nr:hypothetical protein CYY_000901 [Polysphondylium violaceum]